jgi:hypothetical protein
MKTIFGGFSSALAGVTAQSIAAAANSGQTVVLNLRFTIFPFTQLLLAVEACCFGMGSVQEPPKTIRINEATLDD